MAREDVAKANADSVGTARIPGERSLASGSGTSNLIRPPAAPVPTDIPQPGMPLHLSGSRWTPLQSGPLAHSPYSKRLQPQMPIPRPVFASQLVDVVLEQTASQPPASHNNYQLTPEGTVHDSCGLVLPGSFMPLGSTPEANTAITAPLSHSSGSQDLSRQTICPAELHRLVSTTSSAGSLGAGGLKQGATRQVSSRSLSQQGRYPRVSEVPKTVASHDARGLNQLQPTLSLDTATAISAMPRVAGLKRTREDNGIPQSVSKSHRTTNLGIKQQSHERQISRKRVRLPQDMPNEDSDEIQYLGSGLPLTLSRPIPLPSLVRSASSLSFASHSTAYATSPETCPPSRQQSLAPRPAWSSRAVESPPYVEPDMIARGSSKQPPMPCPSPSLQYVWDAIDYPVIVPPNWDVKAFDEAMQRPAVAEDMSIERTLYPFAAAKYDPDGLAKGRFEGRSQAELEAWFSRTRRWESEHPEVVAAETWYQNEELRILFGN
ncbi:hypothetical protein M407DRAFT_18029 [Tulasnella calospora MUT 4182]|uniref:Uncharacterized protein n=1 Tax=Tulasnella calospora MUT 4182 TaxID=1051891 RepID=A0A0C3QWE0_9AGAM|nr:hypothetical protein M407DRAFT_18029 [Tulasnella calospora MUT 4182]